ncbi:FISUMP domain-containing protein, partial [uncultured Fibrobacter sp.]|uniref:FISUMP domain-containing protein n=1 Tax=uncultured Fibrobacter sp. TaxID=261512 RepID=UPI0025D3A4D0
MTDERDGQTYKTVTIGTQTWMAENLNYDTDATNCYDGREDLCTIYGGLYKWGAAMFVCPSGWHLPDTTEWKALLREFSPIQLKSSVGWIDGTNESGFSIAPTGYNETGYNVDYA